MKKSGIIATMMIAVMMLASVATFAQGDGNGRHRGLKADAGLCNKLPDLTDDQKDQIQALRVEHKKVALENRNQLAVLKAELKVLTTAENADMKGINKKADEIGTLKTKMAKQRLAHHQEVRKLLTEEQRLVFDTKMQHHRGHGKGQFGDCAHGKKGKHHRHGNKACDGKGPR